MREEGVLGLGCRRRVVDVTGDDGRGLLRSRPGALGRRVFALVLGWIGGFAIALILLVAVGQVCVRTWGTAHTAGFIAPPVGVEPPCVAPLASVRPPRGAFVRPGAGIPSGR